MRKQTKVVAVASAAALLAIGASMTSFAATGWVEEDGTWYFYDKDGNRVEDTWKKSGDNWYWMDSEEGGAMAMDKIVEDDDDIYYVDSNGVMVRNSWVKVVNEDQDEDDDPAEFDYYYFQSNGKGYKAGDNGIRFRTIDGKRYAFDEDGKMLYGWVDGTGERQTGDDGWKNAEYYLGSWDDGAMKVDWQKITVYDDAEDDDMDYWFNFRSNGKKRVNDTDDDIKEVKIDGRKYGFNEYGVMTYEWTLATGSDTIVASAASTSNWRYFNSVEDGARVTKDWFRVIAPHEDNDNVFRSGYSSNTFAVDDADDENERWYYADGNGKVVSGEIRKIKGKYYGFRPEADGNKKGGAMLSGLVLMKINPTNGEIIKVLDDSVDSDELDALMDGDTSNATAKKYDDEMRTIGSGEVLSLFYFGNDELSDGAMKYGNTTVTLDGNTYNFYFNKTGGVGTRGVGLTGVDDGKYIYKLGCRIKASSDDKYQVVRVTTRAYLDGGTVKVPSNDIHSGNAGVKKIDSSTLRNNAGSLCVNNDGETVAGLDVTAWQSVPVAGNRYERYYLVNTSGVIQDNKTSGSKDGADWYFYVKNKVVTLYTNNKNLRDASDTTKKVWSDYTTYDTLQN